jgi:hypothetical protein
MLQMSVQMFGRAYTCLCTFKLLQSGPADPPSREGLAHLLLSPLPTRELALFFKAPTRQAAAGSMPSGMRYSVGCSRRTRNIQYVVIKS